MRCIGIVAERSSPHTSCYAAAQILESSKQKYGINAPRLRLAIDEAV